MTCAYCEAAIDSLLVVPLSYVNVVVSVGVFFVL
jgi:hypothetical protein